MTPAEAKKNKSYCFDVTGLLGEEPREIWLGYVGGQLVMGAASKAEEKMKRCMGSMWEVENGIHKRESLAILVVGVSELGNVLQDLLLLFGDNDTIVSDIDIKKYSFTSNKKFWEFVKSNDLAHVIVDSRLTTVMEQKLKEERLKHGDSGNLY